MASSENYKDTSEHSETESSEEEEEEEEIEEKEEEIGEEEIADLDSRNLQPYQYEPTKHGSDSASSSSESELNSSDILPDDLSEISEDEDENQRRGNKDLCKCGSCKNEIREIDCLCCQEVDAISEKKFENQNCITLATEFKTLCLEKFVLQNVLVGLHETRGDPLEKEKDLTNRSLRFAAYKQFIWWVFQRLGKGNRRVIPLWVFWNIRKLYPEENGQYVLFNEGEFD